MATTTISWGDGSGGNIYLTYPSASGDQTVEVSSDANTGSARTKTVTFSASGVSPVTLTVNQEAGGPAPVFYTNLIFDGTAVVQTDYVLPSGCSLRGTIGGETLKAAQGVFITEGGGGKIQIQYGGATSSTRRQFLPFYDSSSYLSSNRYLNFSYSSYGLWMTQKRFGWGNSNYTYTKGSLHPTGGICFGGGGATPFTGFIRTFQIFGSDTQNATSYDALNNYTPVATFRPCTYNGEAGFWYVEGSKFFGNTAGSGTLTATGPL